MSTFRLPLARRLVLNCVGCGFEPASVAIGDPHEPDETYGDRCWRDASLWTAPRPDHVHLDGHDCGRECGTTIDTTSKEMQL